MPILVETRRQLQDRISLFSGVKFNVDAESGLKGVCDYLLSLSPLQLAIEAPVVAIAEAKNEHVPRGIAQCLAELVAAQQFNREQENAIPTVFGVVTTGSLWKFMRLTASLVRVDETEYLSANRRRSSASCWRWYGKRRKTGNNVLRVEHNLYAGTSRGERQHGPVS